MRRLATIIAAVLFAGPAAAGETAIGDHDAGRDGDFRGRLHVFAGVTVYRTHAFPAKRARLAAGGRRMGPAPGPLNIGHANPAQRG